MDVLCAAVSGVVARVICHPLDTAKTVAFTGLSGDTLVKGRVQGGVHASAFRTSVHTIWQMEGVAGFYRGVSVATVGSAPGVAIYLTTYTRANDFLRNLCLVHPTSYLSALPSWSFHLFCGLLAEAVSCVVWVPVDVIKERLQAQSPLHPARYNGSWNALRTIVTYEGLFGLYRGYTSTLASFGPYSAVYFAFYEFFNSILVDRFSLGEFFSALCAGGFGNLFASIVTNPLEFIKTRLQVQRMVLLIDGNIKPFFGFCYNYVNLIDGLRAVTREQGLQALWTGVCSRAAFSVPNAALTMAFYKYLQLQWMQ